LGEVILWLAGLGRVGSAYSGSGKFSSKKPIFQFYPVGSIKISSGRIKKYTGSTSYLQRVRSLLGSGHGSSLIFIEYPNKQKIKLLYLLIKKMKNYCKLQAIFPAYFLFILLKLMKELRFPHLAD